MEGRRSRDLTESQLLEIVNQSDFEDISDVDETYFGNYAVEIHHSSPSTDATDSNEETAHSNLVSRGRTRTRIRVRGGRNRQQDHESHHTSSESENDITDTPHTEFVLRGVRTRGGYGVRGRRGRSRGVRTRGGSNSRNQESDWRRSNFTVLTPQLQEPSYLSQGINSDDLFDYLKEYVDDEIIETIVEKSNQTAIERTGRSLNLSKEECKIYFGITMMMACIPFSQIRLYWNRQYTLPIITQAMSRDRYFLLRNSIKVVFDNDVTLEMKKEDKLWKVRPLLDRVLQGCRKQLRQQKNSIDEMIIPFTGACPIRQFCPGKPNPTGIKAFVLANPNGLVCDIIIYQGKDTIVDENDNQFHLGEKIVLKLTESLVPGHLLYFDRYFTTVRLANELDSRGFKCTGTLMKNRVPVEVKEKITDDKTLTRRGRGSHDVLVRSDGKIAITKWMDNKPVMILSTVHAAENTDYCRRYNRQSKEYIDVSRPEVIKEYNCHMGGVDLIDRLMAVSPARTRTRKWTVRFISHFMDLAVTNSWIKYKQDQLKKGILPHKIFQLREFKRQIAEKLIDENFYRRDSSFDDNGIPEERRNLKPRRPPLVPLPSKAKRKHGIDHLPDMSTIQNRCRNQGCTKKTSVKCTGCNIYLCLTTKRNCFKMFHNSE